MDLTKPALLATLLFFGQSGAADAMMACSKKEDFDAIVRGDIVNAKYYCTNKPMTMGWVLSVKVDIVLQGDPKLQGQTIQVWDSPVGDSVSIDVSLGDFCDNYSEKKYDPPKGDLFQPFHLWKTAPEARFGADYKNQHYVFFCG